MESHRYFTRFGGTQRIQNKSNSAVMLISMIVLRWNFSFSIHDNKRTSIKRFRNLCSGDHNENVFPWNVDGVRNSNLKVFRIIFDNGLAVYPKRTNRY